MFECRIAAKNRGEILSSSELGMIELDCGSTLHHVLECTDLLHIGAPACTEVAGLPRTLAWVKLLTNARSHVIGLILINQLSSLAWATRLWQSPSREILFVWWVRWSLGHIAARTNWSRSWSLVLQTASSAVSKGVLRGLFIFKALARKILRAGGSFNGVQLHLQKLNKVIMLPLVLCRSLVQRSGPFLSGQQTSDRQGTLHSRRSHSGAYQHPCALMFRNPSEEAIK